MTQQLFNFINNSLFLYHLLYFFFQHKQFDKQVNNDE